MNKVKLDSRLKSVASLVRKGGVVADIGTDHAYVVSYLIEKGIIEKAFAADVKEGPLRNAQKNLALHGHADRVELVLSDGLQNIAEGSCNEIIIAGMGGILISEILEKAPWVKNENIHIIAQPMTHAEILRKWLCDNGFQIEKEVASTDGKRFYVAISAYYKCAFQNRSDAYYYVGELTNNQCELSEKYIDKILCSLQKKCDAQKSAGIKDEEGLNDIIFEINTLIGRKK